MLDGNPVGCSAIVPVEPRVGRSGSAPDEILKWWETPGCAFWRFGFTKPVPVSDEGAIISGHGRVMSARELGLREVPTLRHSHLNAAVRRAYVLAGNKLALDAGWDTGILTIEFEALSELDFDLSLMGFSIAEDQSGVGIRAMTLISKSKPASQLTPIAVQFGYGADGNISSLIAMKGSN